MMLESVAKVLKFCIVVDLAWPGRGHIQRMLEESKPAKGRSGTIGPPMRRMLLSRHGSQNGMYVSSCWKTKYRITAAMEKKNMGTPMYFFSQAWCFEQRLKQSSASEHNILAKSFNRAPIQGTVGMLDLGLDVTIVRSTPSPTKIHRIHESTGHLVGVSYILTYTAATHHPVDI